MARHSSVVRVDFEITPEQQALVDSVRAVLGRECPTALVRDVVENGSAPEQPWQSARDLGWTAIAVVTPSAVASMANPGPHGFTEVLYAYTSQSGNNGSAFAGLTGNTLFYNLTGAIAMLVGRFWMIIPAMAIAGSLAEKKSVPPSAGTFPTTGALFVGLVVGVIVIIGGLTFFPALALGPIVEHFAMTAGTLFSSN